MFGIEHRVEDNFREVVDKVNKGNFNSLTHAAASIRRDVISTIERSPYPSEPGTPIHTRRGLAKKAMWFNVSKEDQDAVIGTRYSVIQSSGEPHEKGVPYKGRRYPKRAFVMPGFLRAIPRMAGYWSGSIG